jgi:hypothetical protein
MTHNLEQNVPIQFECLRIPVKWEYLRLGGSGPDYDELNFRTAMVPGGKIETYDPWQMRNKFLSVNTSDPDSLIEFLNKVGMWDGPTTDELIRQGELNDFYPWRYRYGKREIEVANQPWRNLGTFIEIQGIIEEDLMLLKKRKTDEFQVSKNWFFYPSTFNNKRLLITTTSFLQSVSLTIEIDRITQAKVKKCERPDCPVVFTWTGGRARKFHDWNCGHVVSVRNSRKEKAKSTRRKSNGK